MYYMDPNSFYYWRRFLSALFQKPQDYFVVITVEHTAHFCMKYEIANKNFLKAKLMLLENINDNPTYGAHKIFTISFLCSLQLSLIFFHVQIIVHYPSKIVSKELPAHLHSLGIALCKAIKEHISCYFGSIQKQRFSLEISKISATAIDARNLEIPRLKKGDQK